MDKWVCPGWTWGEISTIFKAYRWLGVNISSLMSVCGCSDIGCITHEEFYLMCLAWI